MIQELRDLYSEHWATLVALLAEKDELSSPLLICPPIDYKAQTHRLMIFGQQTYGWEGENIATGIDAYVNFNFAEGYYNSPFWSFVRSLEDGLNIGRRMSVWNNLNKCDWSKDKPPLEIELKIERTFGVIPREIEILNPDVVIFLTGPRFDDNIKRLFSDARFESVPGFNERQLARIVQKKLPPKSFRTYHPNYLRRSGNEQTMLQKLAFLCA